MNVHCRQDSKTQNQKNNFNKFQLTSVIKLMQIDVCIVTEYDWRLSIVMLMSERIVDSVSKNKRDLMWNDSCKQTMVTSILLNEGDVLTFVLYPSNQLEPEDLTTKNL